MPMNLENVGGVSEPGKNSWTSKDALLYALGVGAGQSDPTGFELEFTTENSMNTEQRVLPTLVRRFVDDVLGGSSDPLVAYFSGSGKLSPRDLTALRAIARKMGETTHE